MADAIPWEIFEKKYSRLFKGKNGRVAKPLRLALGSLIIQTKYQYSDRELVDQLTENPYYQYFIGLPGYQEEPPIDASTLVLFRKRLKWMLSWKPTNICWKPSKRRNPKIKTMMIIQIRLLVVEMANQTKNLNKHRRTKELLCLMQPVPHQISGIRRISHCSMKPEKNWKLSSSVSVKVMDFQDHVCIAGKPERTTLHLRKQRNAALRKSEQPFVNS